jgi:hypothetical protein
MSAAFSPVCGRACTMLSIFTASTGPGEVTGSPVNGEVSEPVAAACVPAGPPAPGLADGGELVSTSTSAVTAAMAAVTPPISAASRARRPTLATRASLR